MEITILNTTMVKSSSSSPTYTHNSLIPLTIFDKIAVNLHAFIINGFKPPVPSNDILKKALAATLNHFPHLAGRMTVDEHGHPSIILNDAGVSVVETYVPTTFQDFDSSKQINHLLPLTEGIDELLKIQLNRLACGGLVLVCAQHHRVADGHSMNSFLVAWSRLVRGLQIDPIPFHDRATIFLPRKPPTVEFDHRSIEFRNNNNSTKALTYPLKELVTYFSQAFIQDIKAKIMEENLMNPNQRSYSNFECLLAHVWKKVTQARGLELDQSSQIRLAVNGRWRMKPPVPSSYFGNLVLFAHPRLTVRELLTESHAYVATAIQVAVAKIDNRYFKSFIDFGELLKQSGEELYGSLPEIGNIMCPNLEVNSWLRFDFPRLDFGWGPCAFCRPSLNVEGVLRFLPSTHHGGGVNVAMSLLPQHAQVFEQICYSLEGPILPEFRPQAKF